MSDKEDELRVGKLHNGAILAQDESLPTSGKNSAFRLPLQYGNDLKSRSFKMPGLLVDAQHNYPWTL